MLLYGHRLAMVLCLCQLGMEQPVGAAVLSVLVMLAGHGAAYW